MLLATRGRRTRELRTQYRDDSEVPPSQMGHGDIGDHNRRIWQEQQAKLEQYRVELADELRDARMREEHRLEDLTRRVAKPKNPNHGPILRQRVLQWLTEHPGAVVRAREIAGALGAVQQTVSRWLVRLEREGHAERVSFGKWRGV